LNSFPSADCEATTVDVAPSLHQPPQYVDNTAPHGIKVLFIDGDDDHEYWVQRLRACSPEYQIYEATSGSFGLELCRSVSFDCVVLELVLRDMSGFEALINLVPSAAQPAIPVVVLTKRSHPALLQLAKNNGAQASLTKSRTSGDDLDQAIRKAIASVGQHRKEARQKT
jgi:DNA-binding NarL/FixJ family response regulator